MTCIYGLDHLGTHVWVSEGQEGSRDWSLVGLGKAQMSRVTLTCVYTNPRLGGSEAEAGEHCATPFNTRRRQSLKLLDGHRLCDSVYAFLGSSPGTTATINFCWASSEAQRIRPIRDSTLGGSFCVHPGEPAPMDAASMLSWGGTRGSPNSPAPRYEGKRQL